MANAGSFWWRDGLLPGAGGLFYQLSPKKHVSHPGSELPAPKGRRVRTCQWRRGCRWETQIPCDTLYLFQAGEPLVKQDSKQVQVDLQDLGYETCGRSENEAEREESTSPGKSASVLTPLPSPEPVCTSGCCSPVPRLVRRRDEGLS